MYLVIFAKAGSPNPNELGRGHYGLTFFFLRCSSLELAAAHPFTFFS